MIETGKLAHRPSKTTCLPVMHVTFIAQNGDPKRRDCLRKVILLFRQENRNSSGSALLLLNAQKLVEGCVNPRNVFLKTYMSTALTTQDSAAYVLKATKLCLEDALPWK